MPFREPVSHVTLALLASVEEVPKAASPAVVAIDLALLEVDAVVVEKVTSKEIGPQLKVVVAVEAEAASAEAVAVEPVLGLTAPHKKQKVEITRVPITTTEVTKLPINSRVKLVKSTTPWTVNPELVTVRKT